MEIEQTNLFDLMSDDEAKDWKPKKATDWKWSFADYPQGFKKRGAHRGCNVEIVQKEKCINT